MIKYAIRAIAPVGEISAWFKEFVWSRNLLSQELHSRGLFLGLGICWELWWVLIKCFIKPSSEFVWWSQSSQFQSPSIVWWDFMCSLSCSCVCIFSSQKLHAIKSSCECLWRCCFNWSSVSNLLLHRLQVWWPSCECCFVMCSSSWYFVLNLSLQVLQLTSLSFVCCSTWLSSCFLGARAPLGIAQVRKKNRKGKVSKLALSCF